MEYKKRMADSILKEKLEAFGAVQIVVVKGYGKTTTAKQMGYENGESNGLVSLSEIFDKKDFETCKTNLSIDKY